MLLVKSLLDDVTYIAASLNDEEVVGKSLAMAMEMGFANVLLVDGGSSDRTVALATELGVEVVHSDKGLLRQCRNVLSRVETKYVLAAELDHQIGRGDLISLVKNVNNFPEKIFSFSKSCENPQGYFEKCYCLLLRVSSSSKYSSQIPNGVVFAATEDYRRVVEGMSCGDTYGFDTEFHESMMRLGMAHRKLPATSIELSTHGYSDWIRRAIATGKGDMEFWEANHQHWPIIRRLRSIFHPFLQYGLMFPFLFLRYEGVRAIRFVPPLWLFLVLRYYAWINGVWAFQKLERPRQSYPVSLAESAKNGN